MRTRQKLANPVLQALLFFAGLTLGCAVIVVGGLTGLIRVPTTAEVTGSLAVVLGCYATRRARRFRRAWDVSFSEDQGDAGADEYRGSQHGAACKRAAAAALGERGAMAATLTFRLSGKRLLFAWTMVFLFLAAAAARLATDFSLLQVALMLAFAVPVWRGTRLEVRAYDDELFVRGILAARRIPKSEVKRFEVTARGERHAAFAVTDAGPVGLGPLAGAAPDDERLRLLRSWLSGHGEAL